MEATAVWEREMRASGRHRGEKIRCRGCMGIGGASRGVADEHLLFERDFADNSEYVEVSVTAACDNHVLVTCHCHVDLPYLGMCCHTDSDPDFSFIT